LAHPFDPTRLQITGDPWPVAERIAYSTGPAHGSFSVSDTGTLVYRNDDRRTTQLIWFDRSGNALETVGGSVGYRRPSLSPDGKTVAAALVDPATGDEDLWLIETTRNTPSRFTSFGNLNFLPVWSPDGTRIAFAATRGTPPNLHLRAASGAGNEELLVKSSFNSQPTDWSPDGQFIVYASQDPKTLWDLWLLPMFATGADRKPIPFLQTQYSEHLARFSPDGRWLAHVSDESGTNEVYVRTFPASDFKRRVSTNGGTDPRWRGDGKELFYRDGNGQLMAVGVTAGARFELGTPAVLLKTRIDASGPMSASYAVTRDGQRFLVDSVIGESNAVPTRIVLNWPALSRR
jgi:Tol biopolymer transport system component